MYSRHLETFISVADSGSFSKAAEALYISSTAVIKQINLLEQELGLTLFERTHRGIELTKAGRSVYGDVKYLIRYSKDSITRAKKRYAGRRKNNTHRQFLYDSGAVYRGIVAQNQRILPGGEISDCAF